MIERFIGYMDIQDAGERGARPTMWDAPAAGRVKVGIEIHYAEDGRPVQYVCSSEDNFVLNCEQSLGAVEYTD